MAENSKRLKHNSIGVKLMQDTKSVKNPRKQRKKLFNAPAHIRHKLMAAPLSNELAAQRGAKTLPVRKGDTVRILRGDNKGFEGKVSRVDLKAYRIYLEGLTREKVDGTNIFLPIHPSKVQIRNLNLDDKWRKDVLTRKQPVEKKGKPKAKLAKKAEKPKAEEEIVEEPIIEEEAPKPKEAAEKKPAAKKPTAKKEAPAQEEAPAKKVAKPKATAKKAPEAKKKESAEAAPKPRAKKTTPEGGQ
jgi:large subunit ribosomal protein L24